MQKVVAVGLDAFEPGLLERWAAAGALPNLARLRREGSWAVTSDPDYPFPELVWTMFLTGLRPEKFGYDVGPFGYDPATYGYREAAAYDFRERPPFYALGEERRVVLFDVPHAKLSEQVKGLQIVDWGAHSPWTDALSSPPGAIAELERRHGKHPAHGRDHARIWRRSSWRRLERRLLEGLEMRGAILPELLAAEDFDLFLTVLSEPHSAGHYLYHLSQPEHPLFDSFRGREDHDPFQRVMEACDRVIGKVMEAMPSDAWLYLFSVHGMQPNQGDLDSLVFLPEFLYRWNFPSACGLGDHRRPSNALPGPPVAQPLAVSWSRAIWGLRHEPDALRRLVRRLLPVEIGHLLDRLLPMSPGPRYLYEAITPFFVPLWYQEDWPRMKAFALPSEGGDGYIRINLRGRDPEGIVAPEDYAPLCEELAEELGRLANARSGRKLVREVRRTRASGDTRDDPCRPHADLIVSWEETPADVVESPSIGRIGPLPYRRSGGHSFNGFSLIWHPEGRRVELRPKGHPLDVPATILDLLGAPQPVPLDGRSLIARRQ